MREVNEQLMVLRGIRTVRLQLEEACARGDSFSDITQILLRLANLYSLLDVELISQAVGAESKDEMKKAS
jgi:hypothetical protein